MDRDVIEGCLLGTALGDALGLPWEGLSAARVARTAALGFPWPGGRGLLSDDTEHAALTARAVGVSGGDPDAFRAALNRELRRWFLAVPPGIGFATLRACGKLCLGFREGGVRSAGNGPAMRAPVLGVAAPPDRLRALVRVSTRATHTDPRAEAGAWILALAASRARAAAPDPVGFARALQAESEGDGLRRGLAAVVEALEAAEDGPTFARRLGLEAGVTGFIDHTAPAALWAWLAHAQDPARAIEAAVRLGGDTDSVAAITGGLAGAGCGAEALPAAWIAGLGDWPLTVPLLRATAGALAQGAQAPAPLWIGTLLRNLAFGVAIVLALPLRWLRLWPR